MAMSEAERNPSKLTEALVLARTRAPDLESVKKLNCWASQIGDASIVRRMPNLEVCSLSVNNLRSLEDFGQCPNLQELYIRKNQVRSLSHLHYLRGLNKLRVLWLSDNPCAQGDSYRMTVLRTLPNLHKLDNVVVTEEEVNRAVEEGEELPMPEGMEDIRHTARTSSPLTLTPLSPSRHSPLPGSVDTSPASDDAQSKEEEGDDSGVEASSNHHPEPSSNRHPEPSSNRHPEPSSNHHPELSSNRHQQPEQSEKEPRFGLSAADVQRSRLQMQQDSVKLSWEETNQIRSQLGLKPLPLSKVGPHKSVTTGVTKARNNNLLQSVLLLIRELDKDSLEIVHDSVQQRLQDM